MDSQIVYVKTASGEEAMHQRTRVMQRNVRMVLILVDGKSTVADLILKTGNQKLTENALRELEKADFIAPVVEQDSLWAEGKKVAQEIRAAAIGKARKLSPSNKKEAPDPKKEPAPLMPPPLKHRSRCIRLLQIPSGIHRYPSFQSHRFLRCNLASLLMGSARLSFRSRMKKMRQ